MIDTTTPAAPASPSVGVSDLLPPEKPAMSVEVAQRKRLSMLGDANFRSRVVAGDSQATKQWRDVNRALNPPVDQTTAEGKQYAQRMDSLAYFKAKADLPDAVYDQVAADGPVSLKERQDAQFARERYFKDKAWMRRYLDGDRQANSEMTIINMILGSPIGTYDDIEAFKQAAAKRLSGRTK
jgi:hypothetical protein